MAGLKFQAEVRGEEEEVPSVEVVLNGQSHTAYEPTEGQVVLVVDAIANDSLSEGERISGLMNFLRGILDEEGFRHLKQIVADPNTKDSLTLLMDIVESIVEHFSGDPTTPSRGSSRSQESTGASSTASSRPVASTRSRSPRAGSTTSSTRRS